MSTIEVWAQLHLRAADSEMIRDFFIGQLGMKRKFVIGKHHLTVYHARRPMQGLHAIDEACNVQIQTQYLRFMVMAPGGENPRHELNPAQRKIGVRIRRNTPAFSAIIEYRLRLLSFETATVLGSRAPSTSLRNAFGARHFQPHISLLRAGSGISSDLRIAGDQFRNSIQFLTFDRFTVEIVRK